MTDLRLYQLASAKLLKQFVDLLDKQHIEYWLAYGTLLGAYRHRGFIPWDDDIDLGMERQQYCQLRHILPLSGFLYQDADVIRILLEGKGTRLEPITHRHAKCMLKINGTSILQHNIELLQDRGFSVVVLTGHLSSSICVLPGVK